MFGQLCVWLCAALCGHACVCVCAHDCDVLCASVLFRTMQGQIDALQSGRAALQAQLSALGEENARRTAQAEAASTAAAARVSELEVRCVSPCRVSLCRFLYLYVSVYLPSVYGVVCGHVSLGVHLGSSLYDPMSAPVLTLSWQRQHAAALTAVTEQLSLSQRQCEQLEARLAAAEADTQDTKWRLGAFCLCSYP